ncbi:MAG: DUF2269 family protein [Candidatus Dormibacteria bacterium]
MVLLFLHVLAAIIAFGPNFVFPVIGTRVAKDPSMMRFGLGIIHTVRGRIVIPVALTMPVSGLAMVLILGVHLLRTPYLLVSIAMYVLMVGLGLAVTLPTERKVLSLLEAGASAGSPGLSGSVDRVRKVGMVQFLLLFGIVFLMVFKPGGLH